MANKEQSAKRRLKTAGEMVGLNHSRFLKKLDCLVNNLCDREKYGEAESACLDALEKTERVFGKNCPESVPVLKHLQGIYFCQSLYSKAEALCNRALSIINEGHPDYMEFADGLAAVHGLAGRYDEAEARYKRLLSMKESEHGLHHPHLVEWLNQLAVFYADRGRYREAEPYLLRVLEIVQDCASEDICSISVAMLNLASLYCCRREYQQAEFFITRALKLRRSLRQNDPCLRDLATLYLKQGRYQEAERILTRCLTQNQHLIFDLGCMIWLVIVYELQGLTRRSERMYRKVVDSIKSDTVPAFPDHLDALADLADLHAARGNDERAATVYRFVLEIAEREYGDNPFCTLEPVNDLADFYESRERFDEARPFLKKIMAIIERSFGPCHPLAKEVLARISRKEKAKRPAFPRPRFDCNYVLLKADASCLLSK